MPADRGDARSFDDARHGKRVNVTAVADREGAVRSFDLETGLAIERDSAVVVGVDRQLQAAQSQPIVGEIQRGLHQRRPNALALPAIAHRHADLSDMRPARAAQAREPEIADHFTRHRGDQAVIRVVILRQPLAPQLRARCKVWE